MRLGFLSRLFLAATICAFSCLSVAQPIPTKPLPMLHDAVQAKNFYLLSATQTNPAVRAALVSDKALSQVSAEQQQFRGQALRTCKGNAVCTMHSFVWTDEEIRTVSLALARIYQSEAPLREFVDKDLRPRGAYVLYQNQSGEALLVNAWEICVRGINNIIAVYGEGAAPRYPQIDSISFDVHAADFQERITSLAQQIDTENSSSVMFFDPSLKAAMQLLALNHRDEAGRLEPMEEGENKTAIKTTSSTAWKEFPYTVIVVLGAGPEDANIALSDIGRKRTAFAAEAYHAGKAPFILVSCGYVHPSQTRFAEAFEMKKALIADYNVPEAAIIIDPHARHTTTNIRNAVREIYRYNMPMDRPALVVSSAAHIASVASQSFANRCLKELGYLPYEAVSRPSGTSLVVLPKIESLQQDPLEPLDP